MVSTLKVPGLVRGGGDGEAAGSTVCRFSGCRQAVPGARTLVSEINKLSIAQKVGPRVRYGAAGGYLGTSSRMAVILSPGECQGGGDIALKKS